MLILSRSQLVFFSGLVLIAPFLALLLALLALLVQESQKDTQRLASLLGWGTRLLSIASLVFSVIVAMGPQSEFPLAFSFLWIDFYLDALSVYFVLLVNLVAFFASWYTVDFLQQDAWLEHHHAPEGFHFFFNAFHLTMLVVPMVDNLIVLWMAIELTTLASTLLVRYRRGRPALEAAWKYIIITTAGIIFALLGTIFLADAITGPAYSTIASIFPQQVDPMRWSVLSLPQVAQTLEPTLVTLSFLFVLVGYGTKAGLAPMHTWLPDGHGEAPSPVSALLSGVLLKSALYAILRFYTITNLNKGSTTFTSTILLFAGLFSLVLATPFILKPNKFKRILAYHSLEHMGIIAFGLGIGGPLALFGALLHALNHALTKALMFLTFGNIRREYECQLDDKTEFEDDQISGLLKTMPLSALVLLLGGLGLVGSPPFNIFFSEFIILWAALGQIIEPLPGNPISASVYIVAIALFLITITLIFGGLVNHLGRLLLDRPQPQFTAVHDHWKQLIPLGILLAIILLFGIWLPTTPIHFPQLLTQSVCILQKGAGDVCP